MKAVLLNGSETDLDRLQGAWLSVRGRRPALLLVAGCHFVVRFKDGELYAGTLKLDERTQPKHMDMIIEDGPERHVGKTGLCIYELEDEDTLRWCPGDPGKTERLTAFPSCQDLRYLCMTFERKLN